MNLKYLTIPLILISFSLFAQNPPFNYSIKGDELLQSNNIIPPPPTSAQLGFYGECPVSLYIGRPEITIPIYNIQIGDFNLPINISYNASGNKVSDVASWVGLGWSLNAGGLITRTIRGLRDEIVYNGYTSNSGKIIYDELLDGCQYDTSDYHEFTDLMNISEGIMDGQPDLYYFNFGNYRGSFIFDKDKNIHLSPNNKQILISCVRQNDTTKGKPDSIKCFSIITDDGIKYVFGNNYIDKTFEEINTTYTGAVQDYIDIDKYPGDTYQGNYPNDIKDQIYYNSWYLQQIVLSNKLDTIKFFYDSDTIVNYSNLNNSYFYNNDNQFDIYNSKILRTFSVYYTNIQRLNKILWRGGEIDFIKSDEKRKDVDKDTTIKAKSGYNLSEIKIYNLYLELIKNVKFSTSYFRSLNAVSYEPSACPGFFMHLRLDTLIIDSKKYSFIYDNQEMPSRFSCWTDFWGYFKNFNQSIKIDKPKVYCYPYDINNSIYTGIYSIYPRKHFTGPQYILDGADKYPDSISTQANILKKIIYPTGGSDSLIYELHTFKIDSCVRNAGGLRIKKVITYDGISHYNDIIKSYFYHPADRSSETSGVIFSIPDCAQFNVKALDCVPSADTGLTRWTKLTNSFSFSQSNLETTQGSYIGYENVISQTSSKRSDTSFNGTVISKFYAPVPFGTSYDLCDVCGYGEDCIYFKTEKSITICDELAKNYPGATPYTPQNMDNFPFLDNPNIDFCRGLLLEEKYLNKNGDTVRTIKNEYCFDSDLTRIYDIKASYFNRLSVFWSTIMIELNGDWHYSITAPLALYDIRWGINYSISGNVYLTKKSEKVFNILDPSKYLLKVTEYSYNNYLQLVKESFNNSEGSQIINKYKYPSDYLSVKNTSNSYAQGILNMKENNCIKFPIEKIRSVKSNSTEYVYKGELNLYNVDAMNRFILFKQVQLENTSGLSSFSLSSISNDGEFHYDNNYKDLIYYDFYDAYQNLLQFHKKDDICISYLYDPNSLYPIIKGENVTYSDLQTAVNASGSSLITLIYSIGNLLTNYQKNEWKTFNTSLRNNNLLKNKLITSYSYKPLIGFTSVTDPGNISTYYEYDAEGRLSLIRDDKCNIIKTFTYHYQGQ